MSIEMVFGLLGGLGLFIYGMKQMSEGLQKAAGKRLKRLLGLLTTNRFAGLAVGTAVTSVIQSSSATTVMVVGFVNAGLMTLEQSIGVIMGANIGTTVTAQLIAFKLSHFSLHAIAIGAALYLFSRNDKPKQIGQIILGFGILFLGMSIMKDTMEPLKDSQAFVNMMKTFGSSPILGLLIGTALTIILQSSSASIGIILSMLSVGIIDFWAAVPFLLGGNIGTTITAILSSIGANKSAKQAAAAHFIFNALGAGIVLSLFYLIPNFADNIHTIVYSMTMWFQRTFYPAIRAFYQLFQQDVSNMVIGEPSPERLLANTHTMFNILNTLIWIPFAGFIVLIVRRMVPGEEITIKRGLSFLDERMLETPGFAIDQLKSEVLRMYDIAAEMVEETTETFKNYDYDIVKSVEHKEDVINELEEELVRFMTKFPRNSMTEEDIMAVDMYYAMIDDIESFADDTQDIVELARYKKENKIEFSEEAWATFEECFENISQMMSNTRSLIEKYDDELAEKVLNGEERMDRYQIESRNGHMERLGMGICDPNAGIVYLEAMDDLEHISDQLADITHSILEGTGRK
ncbi:MAG: Na/Pi cotransporter family protein [bacterium]